MTKTDTMVKELVDKYGNKRESLLPILQGVYDIEHFVSDEAMVSIARNLDLSSADVYGKSTFYSFLDTVPRGKFVIRVCKTIVCDMHDKNQIVDTLENILKIKVGETTLNRKFSLLYTNCLGWCHKGPAMLVNDDVYTNLTPESIREIITDYKNRD
ncbi:MAG: NAD(P)H-dependent oxidoreductase subunit E [Desulfobulbaceae bacterium]|nr:NAD(P)H-dependent oxidoreductase subunit E [Candidatus Kapabacteria bacterium]MBS3999634.1 NAD(P)H-dependent oxidoreductase subunit E [Desulfobulbaceae bacterium]